MGTSEGTEGVWEGVLGRGNKREPLGSIQAAAGPDEMGRGWITWGSACQAEECGPSAGGTGEPERAWQQRGSMVGPEITSVAHAGLVKDGRMNVGDQGGGLLNGSIFFLISSFTF